MDAMRNRRRSSSFSPAPADDLPVTRPAALGLHHRSSSGELFSDEKLATTLYPRRLHHEALRTAAADLSNKPESRSSLLDFYEIERITRDLEGFIIRIAAGNKNQAAGRRRKAVGRAAPDMRGLRGFLAKQAVAFCGSDGVVVPEKRCTAGGDGGGPAG